MYPRTRKVIWKVGDRAAFEHGLDGRRGGRPRYHVDHGTVTAIDLPGLPPGIRLAFDEACSLGPMGCYATPMELYRSPKPAQPHTD